MKITKSFDPKDVGAIGSNILDAIILPPEKAIEGKELQITVTNCSPTNSGESTATTPIEYDELGYWKDYLVDCESTPFPALPPLVKDPVVDNAVEHHFCLPPSPDDASHVADQAIFCVAWAFITGQVMNSKDITFGVMMDEYGSMDEQEDSTVIGVLPMRLKLAGEEEISEYLKSVQKQILEHTALRHTTLSDIVNASTDAKQACMFQTLLVLRANKTGPQQATSMDIAELQHYERSLIIEVLPGLKQITVKGSFDSRVIQPEMVNRLLERLGLVALQLSRGDPKNLIADIETVTPRDLEDMWRWNRTVPAPVEQCVHKAIERLASAQPSVPAICAWDGELTYSELDRLASLLAGHLAQVGIGPDVLVPLCFEKSMWTPIAMLGVLKAGGGFVLLDSSLPEKRLQDIVGQIGSRLLLSSFAKHSLSARLAEHVLVINYDTLSDYDFLTQSYGAVLQPSPDSTAYVIFTSGSTGVPKGVNISHRNIASAYLQKEHLLECTPDSRVYDFAAYSFTVSLTNFFMALTAGGCLCIPSDQDRRENLPASFAALQANTVILTPSVAAILSPAQFPGLKSIIFGGEVVRAKDIRPWWGHRRLLTAYANSECTTCVTLNSTATNPEQLASIGKGVNAATWVVDPENHHCVLPPGCIGELLIESPLIGSGYLNDPAKTAVTFVTSPAWLVSGAQGHPGRTAKLYKTGDLVQQNEDGSLNYIGRKDSQIKIRGQRIELGDVEFGVQRCIPEVEQVVAEVIVPQGEETRPMLAAFLFMENKKKMQKTVDRAVTLFSITKDIENSMIRCLPGYMVPSIFFSMQDVPMTATGKTDRRRLRDIGASFSSQQLAELRTSSPKKKRQPSTAVERNVQKLWAQVLRINPESIGLDDSFFRLGGDSIAAMKLVADARQKGLQMTVADLFRNPQLQHLTEQIKISTHDASPPISQGEYTGPVEQSFAQGRLWFLEELHPGLNWYTVPFAVRIKGALQLDALSTALQTLESRHETLRTTFSTKGGTGFQEVRPFSMNKLTVIDILHGDDQGLVDALQQDQTTPFDLHSQPGWRYSVYRLNQNEHVLSIVLHHIISDGWSMEVLARELTQFYSAALRGSDPLSTTHPLPIQYRDYSIWQKQQEQVNESQEQLNYWVRQLQTSRPAEFLCDMPRPPTLSGKAGKYQFMVDGLLHENLKSFCQTMGVTMFIILLATFRATHYRFTGQDDATIGAPNANRDRWELKNMIGFFVNMQCFRIKIGNDSFEELVHQVHDLVIAALANQDVPFDSIVSELRQDRDISRHPIAQVMFAVHPQLGLGKLELEGVETTAVNGMVVSRFDLEVHFFQEENGLRGEFIYSKDLYAPETISSLASIFQNALIECLNDPKTKVSSIQLLTSDEYSKLSQMGLLQPNETNYPRESTVVGLFRQQADVYSSRIAVKDSHTKITYAQLDAESDRVAQWLSKRLLAPETLVGVIANRSCQTITTLMGILKAGLAYLPFDTRIPKARMEGILSSIRDPKIVLVGDAIEVPECELDDVQFIHIAEVLNECSSEQSCSNRLATINGPSPTSLAYVMFTSGSTGQPKGVMIEHRGIVRLVKDGNLAKLLPSHGVMAHVANLAFDASTWEIYAALLNGGTLVCIDYMTVLDYHRLGNVFAGEKVQTAMLTPALLKQCLLESPSTISGLDTLYVAGDRADVSDLVSARKLVKSNVINAYGPTENTTFSTTFRLLEDEKCINGVPIGAAISNSGAYVMDPEQQLVPLGVIGELVVTGDGLARGYTDPERNIDRFITVTLGGQEIKAYRTGDYVRCRPMDGQLEFFGRIDGQIKIRGQRVEVGEIESVLQSQESISNAVVVLQERGSDDKRLVAYVTVDKGSATPEGKRGDDDQLQHVEAWEERFDSETYMPINDIQLESIGRDFVGWTSMYDGSDIDKAEMNEWLEDTMNTIYRIVHGQPKNVLEIGSGTGMILFNLAKGLESYVGLDPSQTAVQFCERAAKTIPAFTNKVQMYKATAADINGLRIPLKANLAIINSVVQYFPSQEYLFNVVEELAKVEGITTLFFGDIRSYALHREFLATRAFRISGDSSTKAGLRRMVEDMERVELELLVDPAFFTSLPSRIPQIVKHVEILPKMMMATNELSSYRYAAIVYIKEKDQPEQEVRHIEDDKWINFEEERLDRHSLLQRLKKEKHVFPLAVKNIPHSKTIFGRCLLASLDEKEVGGLDAQDWLSSVRQAAEQKFSLSATELKELAQETNSSVEISWSRQYSQKGGLDAVFHQYKPKNGENRVMFQFPSDHRERPQHGFSSKPLRQQFVQHVQQQLERVLKSQLPAYMIPQSINVIEEIPINENGKVDRKALIQREQQQITNRGSMRQPSTRAEQTMQRLWAQVLKTAPEGIDLNDNFFRLGGDSIAVMKLVGNARKTGISLTVADVFQHPRLADLSCLNNAHIYGTTEIPAFSLLAQDIDIVQVREEVAISCNINPSIRSGDYIMQSVLELQTDINEVAFCAAWEQVVQSTPILRTRIVQHARLGLLQVVVAEGVKWAEAENLDRYTKQDKECSMDLGEPLARYCLVKEPHGGKQWFVWTIHHALYDGWTLPRIVRTVTNAYNGDAVMKQAEYGNFIKYLGLQDEGAATRYWQDYLSDCQAISFPPLSTLPRAPLPFSMVECTCSLLSKAHSGITTSTFIRAAWAIITGCYTNSDDIVFGATLTGRNAPVNGIEAMIGPTIATVPVRVRLAGDQNVSQFLEVLQQQATEMIPFEQTGLQSIAKIGQHTQHACSFQTLLLVQPAGETLESDKVLGKWHVGSDLQEFTTYSLLIQCTLADDGIHITASYNPQSIEHWLVEKMLAQFSLVLHQLASADLGTKVKNINILTPEDRHQLWNSNVPLAVNQCVHEMFTHHAKAQPNAPAIYAWDGEMSYGELDKCSTQLAGHLINLGVKPNQIVPLYFEKSIWTNVAAMSVLKAGCAFVLLDSSLPQERLQNILKSVHPDLIISSMPNRSRASQLCKKVISINSEFFSGLEVMVDPLPDVPSSSLMYVIFTSGSTGQPKGVMISHKNMATAIHYQSGSLGFTTDSRVYDFASYSFDPCITNIFTTIATGGCLCVPKDEDRKDRLAHSIASLKANTIELTPSVSQLLDPSKLHGLRSLMFGGEALHIKDVTPWWDRVRVANTYGPSECTPTSTINIDSPSLEEVTHIGRGVGLVTWVVNPENHDILVAPGCVGELLLEGPLVGLGYLHNPKMTAAAFIKTPSWLKAGVPGKQGREGRLYKTGDLVQYNEKGNLKFIGRKDTQVKLRGQRVELGDVESHVRDCIPGIEEVVAEVISPVGKESSPMLAVFVVETREENTDSSAADPAHTSVMQIGADITDKLHEVLPRYMVPGVFFTFSQLPMTAAGKIDRRRLREIGSSFSVQQLADMRTPNLEEKPQPSTKSERVMQQLWAQVLRLKSDSIGLDDSFFRLGGDSIAAMKLVGNARQAGIHLTVANIFQHPRLAEMSCLKSAYTHSVTEEIPAFSLLLGQDVDVAQVREEVAISCNINTAIVEDIYPCSPLQEGLISLTLKKAGGDYVMQSVLELKDSIDEGAFRAAWEQVVHSTPILRTRIIQHDKLGLLQVVVAEKLKWTEAVADNLDEYAKQDKDHVIKLGEPLARYNIVKEPRRGGRRWFVWTIHHALYDGWTLPRIVDKVREVYNGGTPEKQPGFNTFIGYLGQQDQKAVETYWTDSLADCQATPFPPLPPSIQQPSASSAIEYQCLLPKTPSDMTMSTVLQAAWAIIVSRYTDSEDVVFGATVTGRNAPVPAIEAIIGPTIATVPVRIHVASNYTTSAYLNTIQQQAIKRIPFEQTGLQRIAKMGPDARHACGFQTLLLVQPEEGVLGNDMLGTWHGRSELSGFTSYGLVVQCALATDGIHITASFDAQMIEEWLAEKMLAQFSFVLHQLASADPEAKIADINILTPEDKRHLWEWNSDVPLVADRCIHDMFADQAKAQPNTPAICAWDGEMSYMELEECSTRLASHIISIGVKPNGIVPLCFEKSMWTVVSLLAVLKAGCAFLLLDPSLPAERLKSMCRKGSSTLALTSRQSALVIGGWIETCVIVDKDFVHTIPERKPPSMTVRPTDSAYVIFTSGSTGEPKGCRIDHRSCCSAISRHGPSLGMQKSTRALQFGSYSFAGSLVEMLPTLVHGGCVCIPSEEERRTGLSSAISQMKINWAFLTSTVLDLISPQLTPSLKTVCVGGEPIRLSQITEWENLVHLRQTYGSSETSGVVSSMRLTSASTPRDVGKADTGRYWIVDSNDHSKLVPIGVIGEVLVEGPILGQEYIGEPEKTASAFINPPAWRTSFRHSQEALRLYKTGDLARFKSDGSIELLGRKDSQVKLRGQRIELGEIEHQARLANMDVEDLAVELVWPRQEKKGLLACFIVPMNSTDDHINKNTEDFMPNPLVQATIQAIQQRLEQFLPQYMIPSLFIPVTQLPKTSSRKVDRRRLREIGGSLSSQQLVELRQSSQGLKRMPSTEIERVMQQSWARALNLAPESISLDDNFFRLGGDSIVAMKLVSEAREVGIPLLAADIFRHKTLAELSLQLRIQNIKACEDPHEDFLANSPTPPGLAKEVESLGIGITAQKIESILPLTSFQTRCVEDGIANKLFCNYFYLDLGRDINLRQLEKSCDLTLKRFSILRACFLQLSGSFWQVVLRHLDRPVRTIDVDEDLSIASHDFCLQDIREFTPTTPPLNFVFLRHKMNGIRLILRMSHAQYDGFCLPTLVETLSAHYNEISLPQVPNYSAFLSHIAHSRSESIKYWQSLLYGSYPITSQDVRAKLLPHDVLQNPTPKVFRAQVETRLPPLADNITPATLVSTAWAVILSRITSKDDVTYGHLVAGRNSALRGIDHIVGPCANIIPIRARLPSTLRSTDLLLAIREQLVALGEADSLGSRDIIKHCTSWTQMPDFDIVIQHLNMDVHPEARFSETKTRLQFFSHPDTLPPYKIYLMSYLEQGRLVIDLYTDTHVMDEKTANSLLLGLVNVLDKLTGYMNTNVRCLLDGVDVEI
ncbi:hypothetical protein B0J11DRAFT_593923 [Dendryphion nanum]|uniref:Carrier domain-containing protein n=1 Tax=Dendryphion nanum TaxID=256645 RepID=A0A9P9IE54_9PLEO|nr:hypothetical protein B0J11DRAFT_593923 [Dendryphion nanum]